MCAICHTNLNNARPPMKDFPKLASFNAQFDHAQHMQGVARPQSGCSAFHLPLRRSSAALSIPAGLVAHAQSATLATRRMLIEWARHRIVQRLSRTGQTPSRFNKRAHLCDEL